MILPSCPVLLENSPVNLRSSAILPTEGLASEIN
jgi:hypothetical protein